MKIKNLCAFLIAICWVLVTTLSLVVVGSAEESSTSTPEPIVLKAVSFDSLTHINAVPLKIFMERVYEQSNGELEIKYLGASEVIALYDQPEALRTGVVDILITFPASYIGILPIAAGMSISNLDPPQWRQTGAHEFLVKAHKKVNMRYLGSFGACEDGSYLFLKKRIEKPEDLTGLKIASGPTNVLSIAAWGGAGVNVPLGEKYSALEQGIVDGVAGVLTSHYKDSLYEVAKYWIPHVLSTAVTSMLMNLDSWESLPEHLQDLIIDDVIIPLEREAVDIFRGNVSETIQKLLDEGMEIIEFSPADAKRFSDVSLGAKWADIEKDVDPVVVQKFKEMISK